MMELRGNEVARIVKYNGGYGNNVSKKPVSKAVEWFNKNGYSASKVNDLKKDIGKDDIQLVVVGQQIIYRKSGCKTEYTMTIMF